MQVEIRPARPQDAAALALVGQASFLETYAGQLPAGDILDFCAEAHGIQQYADYLAGGARWVWIVTAVEGGAPVGYAVVTAPDLPLATEAGDLELKRFYLLGRLQGLGVGARLMRSVMGEAQAMGARRMLLGVFSANARAIAFYARQGFSPAGVRKFRVGQGVYDDLILARSVVEPAT